MSKSKKLGFLVSKVTPSLEIDDACPIERIGMKRKSTAPSKESVDEMFKSAGVESSVVDFLRAIQSNDSFKGVEVEKEFQKAE